MSQPDYEPGQILAFNIDGGSFITPRWRFGRVQRATATTVRFQGTRANTYKKYVRALTDDEQAIVEWLKKQPRTSAVHINAPRFEYTTEQLVPTELQLQSQMPIDRLSTLIADLQQLSAWWKLRPNASTAPAPTPIADDYPLIKGAKLVLDQHTKGVSHMTITRQLATAMITVGPPLVAWAQQEQALIEDGAIIQQGRISADLLSAFVATFNPNAESI